MIGTASFLYIFISTRTIQYKFHRTRIKHFLIFRYNSFIIHIGFKM